MIALGCNDKINEVYAASDIIISSSAFGEGFSNALGEGMASGLVPVSTNVGDAKYIIKNLGKIVDPKSSTKLARAVLEVLNLSENDFKSYQNKVRVRIIDHFSKDIMLKNYDKIYNDLIAGVKK